MKKLIIAASLIALLGAGCANQDPSSSKKTTSAESSQTVTTDENGVSTLETESGTSIQFETAPSKTQPATSEDDVPVVDVMLGGETKSVNMEATNFAFSPKTIKVKAGESVKVTFTKVEGTHTFVIDGITNVKTELKTGVAFTAPSKPGTYPFYCDVGNHRAMGMEGLLLVE